MNRAYYVYIMSNTSRRLYVGKTNNLERRVWEHRAKETESFTKRYNMTTLVHMEEFPDPASAIQREKQLKGWLRSRKIELVEETNPNWLDLAANWFSTDDWIRP